MGRLTRIVLGAVGLLIVLVVIAAVSLPLFLNADSFRTRIESTLSKSLGRTVTIGKLSLSVWSGGLLAENAVVADDPKFSSQPFLQADSVKIRVEMLPLILHRDVQVKGFVLDSPKVQLLRAANGMWNYSSIGGAAGKQDEETKKTFPNLTVGHVEVTNGRITVGTQPGAGSTAAMTSRVYEQVGLDVKNFGFCELVSVYGVGAPAGGRDGECERDGGSDQPAGCVGDAVQRAPGGEACGPTGGGVCGCFGRDLGAGGEPGAGCGVERAADARDEAAGGQPAPDGGAQ